MEATLKLDGYVRVSRVGGRSGEGYISPSVQRDAISAYAKELSGEVVAWHEDEDYTGGNMDRPAFQQVLQRLRASETDGVVVMRLDRFSRSVVDGASIVREIVGDGKVFASCQERIDPSTDHGKYMLAGLLANAELFLDQAKSGWQTAKARAVARGVHIGPTPIGFRREKSMPLEPDPTYARAITALFTRAATGKHGDSALARWFTERAPRQGGAVWKPSEIRRWLSNRVYLGEVHYGELVNPDAHPALTDAETWQRCQREPGVQRRGNGTFLLRGLVRCAACRYALVGQSGGGATGATPVYRCSQSKAGGCPEPSVITAAPLEAHMRQLALERVRGLKLEAAADGLDLAALDAGLEAAEAELQAFAADLAARRKLGEAGWQDALTARALARDDARAAREAGYAQSRIAGLTRDVDGLDHDALRDLLAGMVRHVFIRRRPRGAKVDDRALVVWSDDTRAIDVPGPHVPGPFEPIGW